MRTNMGGIRNYVIWGGMGLLVVSLFFVSAQKLSRDHGRPVPVQKAVPYTAVLQATITEPGGEVHRPMQVTTSVRSDGSRAMRFDRRQPDQAITRVIDFASGNQASIDELREMKTTAFDAGRRSANWLRDPRSHCMNSLSGQPALPGQVVLKEEQLHGYRTVVIQYQDKLTWWFALNHGCALIQQRADWGGNKVYEQKLLALIPGEPSEAHFLVPDSFREVPPSEMRTSSLSAPPAPAMKLALARDDEWYKAHRAQ